MPESAVQLRHYPVTVSAENHDVGKRHWSTLWEGSMASMKRKSGYRLCCNQTRGELGGGYQITPQINIYTNIQNLLSQHFYEAFGYPALPLTFRSGIKFNFGGDSWKLD
jgi:hypothetical protein